MLNKKKLTEEEARNYYNLILKFILWDMAFYHVLIGSLGLIYTTELEEISRRVFNLSLTITPETLWLIRPLATYIIIFGVMMGIAAYDPQRFRPIIYGGLIVLFLRFLQYISFIFNASNVSASKPIQPFILMFVVMFTFSAFLFLLIKTKEN